MKVRDQIRALRGDDCELIFYKEEIAGLFDQFCSIFEKKAVGPQPEFKNRTSSLYGPEKILEKINEAEIEQRLKRLNEGK